MMLQGVPSITTNSGDGGASAQPHESSGGGGGFSEEERGRAEEGERNSGGNRWPRQETLALLKIRSDMDVAFRDSNLKGPLWDEVSRKLAELGYHRSAKKCKEKFENVYKYHKRTKDGRTSKADGKTYRFFDQLQALEAAPGGSGGSHPPTPPPPPPLSKPPQVSATMPNSTPQIASSLSTPFSITGSHQNNVDPISVAAPAVTMPTTTISMSINHVGGFPFSNLNMSGSTNSTSSSSTSSDAERLETRRKGKRKWKEFFGRLMKEVIEKQEELQSRFIDTLERRERDRMAREDAWRQQEMAKMKRERELLVQERSMAAAKDTAFITFLQKISEQNPQMPAISILQQQQQQTPTLPPTPPTTLQQQQPRQQQQQQQTIQPSQHQVQSVSVSAPVPVPVPVPEPVPPPVVKSQDNGGGGGDGDGGGGRENMLSPSPSRWPKAEINALIKLRTTLDTKYQENGPKGPLWEEISAAMRNLGYNRNAKRCKEKWENINKYYKKVKESSKKRPEDSKTCPYFHQLDAIYKERASNLGFGGKPEAQAAPIMAQPEQQWPLPAQHLKENYDDQDDDDEEDEGGEYEIVPNKTSSMAGAE